MIFVTLGTHEQGFDRLVIELDNLKQSKAIGEEVFIQGTTGKYTPKFCTHKEILAYDELCGIIQKSRIVITHGGPGSIILSLRYGKIPIVVPRMHKFGEHVDDHQVRFAKKLESQRKILAVYEIGELKDKIKNYDILIKEYNLPKFDANSRSSLIQNLEQYMRNIQ
jgi:UDP-N-acetylglucosamine transferase subunit ALG13